MKKAFTGLILGLCCWAAASVSQATHYALCTGLNKYSEPGNDLSGCVPDAKNVYTNILLRGEWKSANTKLFTDSQGTFAAVSNQLMGFASAAASGDVVLYYHSSHGYQSSGTSTGICMYDKNMSDTAFAKILANFKAGVKVVIVLDTCHSGGMFKGVRAGSAVFSPFAFARRVNEELAAIRADEAARGIRTAAKLQIADCGWVSAADYDQYSWDGDVGGAFTECFVGSVKSGACDESPYGNGDSYATFMEMFDYAVAQDETHGDGDPTSEDYTMPQCTNTTVLKAVTFGWVGKEEPTGIRFAQLEPQTMTVGVPLSLAVTATNRDGSAGPIAITVSSGDAPAGTYSYADGFFSFDPTADGSYSFDFAATNATAGTYGKASLAVTATLAAPVALAATAPAMTSFNANWQSVAGAASYELDVATAASFSTGGTGELVREGFDKGTSLSEGWTLESGSLGVYDSSGNYGSSSPSLKLSSDVTLSSPALSAPTGVSFWLKGNGSSMTSTLVTEQLVGGAWKAVGTESLPTKATTVSYDLDPAATQLRFVFTKTSGNAALDDVVVTGQPGESTLVLDAENVGNATTYTVSGLDVGREYFYRVRARNNGLSANSGTISVATIEDPTAPPTIYAIADQTTVAGVPVELTVGYSSAAEAGDVVLGCTEASGDTSATLDATGAFVFPAAAPGSYTFTINASNNNGAAEPVTFAVAVGLAVPVAAEASEVGSDSFTANWEAVPGAASYLLTVVEGAGAGGTGGVVVSNDFSAFTKASSYAISDWAAVGLEGWSGTKMYPDVGMLKGGAGSDRGILETPTVAMGGTVTISFDAKAFNADATVLDVGLTTDGGTSYSSELITLTSEMTTYTVTAVGGESASVRFQASEASKQRFYIDNVVILASGSKNASRAPGDLVLDAEDVGDTTSYAVTGLAPLTQYSYFVAAKAGDILSEASEAIDLTTTDGPAAPAWSEIPAQVAMVGTEFTLDLAAYVSGSPSPALSADAGSITGTVLTWTPDAAGSVSIALTAANDSGTAEATLAVDVGLAAPVAADATDVGATSFTANWAAVAGAQSYLLTVVEGKGAPSGGAVTDTLTADGLGLGSSYGDGSYVSTASGAEFAAYAMKKSGGTAIQINSKNDIGIVTTVSGGSVSAVRVGFDSSTKSGNTVNVYGSSAAYSSSADLYTDSTAGKLIGTITYNGSDAEGSLAIDGSYAFIGLRSASGAIYLDTVEIDWNGSAKAARAEGDLVLDAKDVGNVTSYPVTGLSMLTHYSYTVAAKAGDVVSEASEAVSLTTLESEVAPVWSDIPEQSATLGEPFVFDFAAYLVANPAATVTASAGTVDGTVLTFTPDSVEPTTITLTAVNTLDSAATTVVIVAVPAAPEVVEPTTVSSNSFVAVWQEVEGADSYHLVVVEAASASSASRAAGDVVFEGDVTGTSKEVTGLAPETDYSYTVAAIVDGVAGPASEPVAVTTKAGPSAPAWSAIPAQNTYVGATFQLDLSAFLSGNPEPTVTADVGTVTGLNYVYEPETTGSVTVTLTAVNESGSKQASFVLTVAEAPTGGTHYAVVVGCNQYNTNYVPADNFLNGCVPDANHVHGLITSRGLWDAANVTKLTDSAAKHSAVLSAIAAAASRAVAGDTFLYFHSSHGGNYTYTFVTNTALYTDWPIMVYSVDPEGVDNCICTYDADFTAAELASALADFDPAVNIVVMIDACHSAGMFQYDGTPVSQRVVRRNAAGKAMRSGAPSVFAEAVRAQIGAIRRARGIRAASNVAFVTAANFDEYSYDAETGDGGEFTTAFIEGVTNGVCDGAEYGDQDGWATFYEGWNYAKDIAVGMPEGTVVDYEGHTVDANGYALYDNSYYAEEYEEPEYYYDYYFTHAQIDNEALLRVVRVGYAGDPTLDAPVANEAADVTASSFTASWSAVADATGYRLQVATDESFSTGAASDTLVATNLAATATSYTDFSGVEGASGAVYAGTSAKSSDGAIQLNNSKSAGIWTTASGGNVSRVAVKWNTSPASGRSVKVYGSATPLTSYSAASAATPIGTLTASVTSLDVTDAYAYVGILPSGGAIYLDYVTIDWGVAGSGSTIVLDQNVGKVTSFGVTGLDAETDYFYRVQALGDPVDSDFSNVISLTTDGGTPAAPAWDAIPPQTVVAGQDLVVDLNPYVSGSPKPTITADAGTVENGVLTVSFAEAGPYTVTVTAENSEDSASATIAVTVTAAPVTVPVLTLSNATDTTFDAAWTACSGATGYQLQVATDDQFSTGGGGEGGTVTETFANATFSTTSSSYVDQTITGCDLGTWTATSCRGDGTAPIVRYAGTLTSPSLEGGVAAVEFDYEWPYKESGTCDIDLYVNDSKAGSATVTGGTAGTAVYSGFAAVSGPATIEFRNTGTSNKRMQITQVRITSASKSVAKDGGSLVLDTTTSELAYPVTGLEPETTYYARVRMAGGEWSEVQSVTTAASGGEPVEVDIAEVTIAAGNLSFAVPAGATVMTTGDLVNGPWVEYDGEIVDGQVVIPMTGDPAFFRIGNPPAGN